MLEELANGFARVLRVPVRRRWASGGTGRPTRTVRRSGTGVPTSLFIRSGRCTTTMIRSPGTRCSSGRRGRYRWRSAPGPRPAAAGWSCTSASGRAAARLGQRHELRLDGLGSRFLRGSAEPEPASGRHRLRNSHRPNWTGRLRSRSKPLSDDGRHSRWASGAGTSTRRFRRCGCCSCGSSRRRSAAYRWTWHGTRAITLHAPRCLTESVTPARPASGRGGGMAAGHVPRRMPEVPWQEFPGRCGGHRQLDRPAGGRAQRSRALAGRPDAPGDRGRSGHPARPAPIHMAELAVPGVLHRRRNCSCPIWTSAAIPCRPNETDSPMPSRWEIL